MSKRLGYTWYSQQWRSSIRVFKLSLSERGLYRELIDSAYEEDNKILIDIETWARQFACSQDELKDMLLKLEQMKDKDGIPLITISENILSVPSCEPRLNLIRGGKKGGETSKKSDEYKPKSKPMVKPTPKPKGNQKEKEIEKEIEIEKENKEEGDTSPTHTPEELDLFNKFCEWIEQKAPRVNKMKEPLTIKQFFTLKKKFDSKVISEVLIAMQNRADLLKKYVSAYLTINNWAKNQNTKTENEQSIQTRVRQSEATRH